MNNSANAYGSIDISTDEKLKYWANLLCCSVNDLRDAVRQIGSNYNSVDTFLILNRRKLVEVK